MAKSLTSPITLAEMSRSDKAIDRILAAGQKLSNLAYHVAQNGGSVTREQWRIAQEEWDNAVYTSVREGRK